MLKFLRDSFAPACHSPGDSGASEGNFTVTSTSLQPLDSRLMLRSSAMLVTLWPMVSGGSFMTASFVDSVVQGSDLTNAQLRELNADLCAELRRLTPGS